MNASGSSSFPESAWHEAEEASYEDQLVWPGDEEQMAEFFLHCTSLLATAVEHEIHRRQGSCYTVAMSEDAGEERPVLEIAHAAHSNSTMVNPVSTAPTHPSPTPAHHDTFTQTNSMMADPIPPAPTDLSPGMAGGSATESDFTMADPVPSGFTNLPFDVLEVIAEATDPASFGCLLSTASGMRRCLAKKWFRRMNLLTVTSIGIQHLELKNVPHQGWSILPLIGDLTSGQERSWELTVDMYYLIKKPMTIWNLVQQQPRLKGLQVVYTPGEIWMMQDARLPYIAQLLHNHLSSHSPGFCLSFQHALPLWSPYDPTPPPASILVALNKAFGQFTTYLPKSRCGSFRSTPEVLQSTGLMQLCLSVVQSPDLLCIGVDGIRSQQELDFIGHVIRAGPAGTTAMSFDLSFEAPVAFSPSFFSPASELETLVLTNYSEDALQGHRHDVQLPGLVSLTLSPIFHSITIMDVSRLAFVHLLFSYSDVTENDFCAVLRENSIFMAGLGQLGLKDIAFRISLPPYLWLHLQQARHATSWACSCSPDLDVHVPTMFGIARLTVGVEACSNSVDDYILRLGTRFHGLQEFHIDSRHVDDPNESTFAGSLGYQNTYIFNRLSPSLNVLALDSQFPFKFAALCVAPGKISLKDLDFAVGSRFLNPVHPSPPWRDFFSLFGDVTHLAYDEFSKHSLASWLMPNRDKIITIAGPLSTRAPGFQERKNFDGSFIDYAASFEPNSLARIAKELPQSPTSSASILILLLSSHDHDKVNRINWLETEDIFVEVKWAVAFPRSLTRQPWPTGQLDESPLGKALLDEVRAGNYVNAAQKAEEFESQHGCQVLLSALLPFLSLSSLPRHRGPHFNSSLFRGMIAIQILSKAFMRLEHPPLRLEVSALARSQWPGLVLWMTLCAAHNQYRGTCLAFFIQLITLDYSALESEEVMASEDTIKLMINLFILPATTSSIAAPNISLLEVDDERLVLPWTSQILVETSRTVVRLSEKDSSPSQGLLSEVVDYLKFVVKWTEASAFRSDPLVPLVDALDGGSLSLLLRALTQMPEGCEAHIIALSILEIFTPYVLYKPVLRLTTSRLPSIHESVALLRNRPKTAKALICFYQTVDRSKASLEKETSERFGMCQRLCVRGGDFDVVPKSRECSQCTSVRYCSRLCQKEDWGLHRLECRHRKQESDRQIWVSRSAKFALTHHMELLFRSWLTAQTAKPRGMVTMELRFLDPFITASPIFSSCNEVDAPPYIFPRLEKYAHRALEDQSLQLILGVVSHGTRTLYLLALVGAVGVVGVTSYAS
ncbi:hypothetical protein BKA70DRAFT_1219848 [Coprinopsis sp. MPI-PUGE-AT-0042]|nr:hypothetical protein BKA70DRAFT_1219848 [Coprinopsis sp. MPI-PUGE-AT-0042]